MTLQTDDLRSRTAHSAGRRLVAPAISQLSHALNHALLTPGMGLAGAPLATPSMAPRTPPPRRLGQGAAGWQCRPASSRSMAPATARAARYRQSPRLKANGKGVALIELMLVVGTIMVVSGGVFAVYKVTDTKQRSDREIKNAGEIATNLTNVMASSGGFGKTVCTGGSCVEQPIDEAYAVASGIFPDRMVDGSQVNSTWGGVNISNTAVSGVPNWGAKITYNNVPSSACATFVRGASNGFYEIRINDQVLRTNYTTIQPTALANLCGANENSTIDLIYAKNAATGVAVGPVQACVAPPPESSVTPCPAGQGGTITRIRDFHCNSPYGSALPGAWSPPVSTCAPLCALNLPTPNPESENATQTGSRSQACPAGQVTPAGANAFTQTRQESRTHSRTASCVGLTDPYVWSAWGPWTPWAGVTGPAGDWNPLTGCAPQCVLPTPSTQTETGIRTVPTTAACPAGQLGLITYSHEERQTRSQTATCPAPTGAYVWSAPGPWSPWAPTTGPAGTPALVSNTCAPICVAPPTVNTPGSQGASCAPGRLTPAGGTSFTQTRVATTTYSCPAPTGSYTTNPTTYTPWSPSEASACAPQCVAPPSFNESIAGTPQSLVTPYSQNAPDSITTTPQTQAGDVQSLTTPYSQAAADVVSTTPQTQAGDQQAAAGTAGTQTLGCPAGQSGAITQTRTTTVYRSTTETRTRTNTQPMIQTRTGTQTRSSTETRTRTNTQPMIQTRTGTQTRSTTQTRTTTYACPAPTGAATSSTTAWSAPGAPYGAYGTPVYSAWSAPTPNGPVEYTYSAWSAPGAPYGAYSAPTYTPWSAASPNGPIEYTYSAWSAPGAPYGAYGAPGAPYGVWGTTSNTCTPVNVGCTVAASTLSRSWTGSASGCTGFIQAGTYAHGAYGTASYFKSNKIGITSGSAKYQCVNGTMSSTPTTPYCEFEPNTPTCPGCIPQ